ncbi:nitrate/nitrite transporter NrtS [Altererythrobacter sp.]|uniref:nitrate/nitrite transporter NrtS n=1 Tax=Altererythrobacter sp. TaxID=1872480 RepID=UPI003D0014F6
MFDRSAFTTCFKGAVLRRSLIVALLIGTVLTAINQGDIILAGDSPAIWKVALTYLVPFLVASYGAYSALTVQAKMPSRASEEER